MILVLLFFFSFVNDFPLFIAHFLLFFVFFLIIFYEGSIGSENIFVKNIVEKKKKTEEARKEHESEYQNLIAIKCFRCPYLSENCQQNI